MTVIGVKMREKILIIDDEADFCGIMKNFFIKKDYDASVAFSIREGMALIEENKPDILFLDNNLPDGNGWEIVDRIVEIIPQIRVYLISAHRNRASYTGNMKNIIVWEKPISLQMLNNSF